MSGKFVAFEGTEGAGKSSVVKKIAQNLSQKNIDFITTCEPGGSEFGLKIRNLLLNQKDQIISPYSELLLINAARIEHLNQVIRPALRANKVVLCDRFIGSTLAYQGAGSGINSDIIKQTHRLFCDNLYPDLTLYLDVDIATGLLRAGKNPDRFESENRSFFNRAQKSFQSLANQQNWIKIDANQSAECVYQSCLQKLLEVL